MCEGGDWSVDRAIQRKFAIIQRALQCFCGGLCLWLAVQSKQLFVVVTLFVILIGTTLRDRHRLLWRRFASCV